MRSNLIVATEALASGQLTRRELGRGYCKLYRNVYIRKGAERTASQLAVAAWLWSGRTAIVGGNSAAALLGTKWIPPSEPAELVRPLRRAAPRGIVVYSDTLAADEICTVEGTPCTTPARTAYDIGRRLSPDIAVQRIDALLNATGYKVADVEQIAKRYPGGRDIRKLRAILELVDPGAESPQESKTRLLLVRAGLPKPVTQIEIHNQWNRVIARIDLGWPEYRVGVEYDGAQHWTDPKQRAWDIERLEILTALGWIIVRVSASQLRYHPEVVLERVRKALRQAG